MGMTFHPRIPFSVGCGLNLGGCFPMRPRYGLLAAMVVLGFHPAWMVPVSACFPLQRQGRANPFADGTFSLNSMTAREVLELRVHCLRMAKTLMETDSPELLEKALESPDFKHRTAAAITFGLNQTPNENLFGLLQDGHGFVALAARESCIIIAIKKHQKKDVDFGPFLDSSPAERKAAADMWREWFKKKGVTVPGPKKPMEEKPVKKGDSPKANPAKVEPAPTQKEPKDDPPLNNPLVPPV